MNLTSFKGAAFAVVVAVFLCFSVFVEAAESKSELNHGFTAEAASIDEWWNIPYPTRFDASTLGSQARLSIEGNRLIKDKKPFALKGVNIADIPKLVRDKQWSKGLFDELNRWNVNAIRIPVHPLAWRKMGKEWYFDKLDQAVVWANAHGIYLIIDWHSIGNLKTQMYQHPMYETSLVETSNFWRDIAFRYRDVPTVAVYEIFNEPTHDFIGNGAGSLGTVTWDEWREILEGLIDIVRVYNADAIPLVTGFNWGYDLSEVSDKPVRRDGVAYAIHPYPQKAKVEHETEEAFQQAWQEQWGYLAQQYHLMATEIGWVSKNGRGAHVPVMHDSGTYGPALIDFMSERNMSWTAWVFDPDWAPVLIEDWNFTPSEQGAFFKKTLQEIK